MKSMKNVTYENLCKLELINKAHLKAQKGKKNRKSVLKMGLESEKKRLLYDLITEKYEPFKCNTMVKYDKNAQKSRIISCPNYRDQIVHHMLILLMKPYFEKMFIQHNVANIPNRGLGYGNFLLKTWSHEKNTKYVLKMDIKHYYPSIPIDKLLLKLSKYIRDRKILKLISNILYKENPNGLGLTLGSYLNLWLALFYLNDFDHIVKEQLHVNHYIRYVDDMLFLVRTKREAQRILKFTIDYMRKLGLTIKFKGRGKAKIYKWTDDRFVDMLGTKTYRNKQVLRKNIYLKIRRILDTVEKCNITLHLALSVLSYKGIVQRTDCKILYQRMRYLISKFKLKEVISNEYC